MILRPLHTNIVRCSSNLRNQQIYCLLFKCATSANQTQRPSSPICLRNQLNGFNIVRYFSSDKPSESTNRELPSAKQAQSSVTYNNILHKLDNVQVALFTASKQLNDFTGYSAIEALKKDIEKQEQHAILSRQNVMQAKEDYKNAIGRRSSSQKEVNELLQRKHAWTSADLERFTSLYRSDHANEQDENQASSRLAEAERTADDASSELNRSILIRYHEEQVWSDKIRRTSTWGTWALMGFNVFLFIVVQLGLEPWKRKRLVGNFEEKVRLAIREQSQQPGTILVGVNGEPNFLHPASIEDNQVVGKLEKVHYTPEPLYEPTGQFIAPLLPDSEHSAHLSHWIKPLTSAFSEPLSTTPIILRKLDVSILTLTSASIGLLMGIAISLIQPR